jgi:hypothetical protein
MVGTGILCRCSLADTENCKSDVPPTAHGKSSAIKQLWRKPVAAKSNGPSSTDDMPMMVYDSSGSPRQKPHRAHRRRTPVPKGGLRSFRVSYHRRRQLQNLKLSEGMSRAPSKSARSGIDTTSPAVRHQAFSYIMPLCMCSAF